MAPQNKSGVETVSTPDLLFPGRWEGGCLPEVFSWGHGRAGGPGPCYMETPPGRQRLWLPLLVNCGGRRLVGGLVAAAPAPHAPAPSGAWLSIVAVIIRTIRITLLISRTGARPRARARTSSRTPLISLALGTAAPALLGENGDRQGHDPGESQRQTSHRPSRLLHNSTPECL